MTTMFLAIFLSLFAIIYADNICNQGTNWECPCPECWPQFETFEEIEWIKLSLDECSTVNSSRLSEKLTEWLNEECSSFVSCPLEVPISPSQLLIGDWHCATRKTTEIRLLLLRKDLKDRKQLLSMDSVTPSWLLAQVVRSRQHLLAFLLQAGLDSVDVYRNKVTTTTTTTTTRTTTTKIPFDTQSTPPNNQIPYTITIIILILLFLFFFSLLCARNLIEWTRVVKGRWRHKAYQKVAIQSISSNMNR